MYQLELPKKDGRTVMLFIKFMLSLTPVLKRDVFFSFCHTCQLVIKELLKWNALKPKHDYEIRIITSIT